MKNRHQTYRPNWPALTLASILTLTSAAGHAEAAKNFSIQPQRTDQALIDLAEQSGIQIIFSPEIAEGTRSPAVQNVDNVESALQAVLSGTDLVYEFTASNVVVVTKKPVIDVNSRQAIIEEIVVTAQKREQRLIDVPISIVALSAQDLSARGINTFEDLGLAVPGLSVQDSGGLNRRVFIRGITNQAGSSSLVGMYIDEATVTGNPAFQLDVRPYDLERVEVLRGPQGTIYGDGSVGGTIRFITKKPELDHFGIEADASLSFTDGGASSQKVQAVVNIPIVEEKLGFRIAGTFDQSGGWIDQPLADREDINDQDLVSVHIKGLWQPTDALEVNASALIHRNELATNTGEDADGNFTQLFNLTTRPSIQDDYDLFNLTVQYDFAGASLLSSTSYLDASRETKQLGSTFPLFAPPVPPLHILFVDYPLNTEVFSQELRISSSRDDTWYWSIGAFYRASEVTQNGELLFGFPVGPLPAPSVFSSEEESNAWAVFGDLAVNLTDWLEAGVGLRYFEDDRKANNGGSQGEQKFDSVSPRFYVNMDVAQNARVYASVAKGFRSGGFDLTGGGTYDPDSVWTYELGTKSALFNGRVDAELALFYSEYQDYQIVGFPPPPAPPVQVISNAGDAGIKGIEWNISWHANDALTIGIGGTILESEFVDINLVSSAFEVGDQLELTPKYEFTTFAHYSFDWQSTPGFVRLDYNHRGRTETRDRSIGSHYFGQSDVINMLNMRAELQLNEQFGIAIFASNILDERGYIDPFAFVENASRPRPRTLGFGVSVDL